jgi:hypothetical protein
LQARVVGYLFAHQREIATGVPMKLCHANALPTRAPPNRARRQPDRHRRTRSLSHKRSR